MKTNRIAALAFAGLMLTTSGFAQAPPAGPYTFLIARLAADEGDFTKALGLMDKLVAAQPRDPVLRYERASMLLDANQVAKGLTDLRGLTHDFPEFYEAQRLLGRVLLDMSSGDRAKVDEALIHLQAAYKGNPDDLGTGAAVAQILSATNHMEEAGKVLASLAERAPDNRTINYQYAQILTKLGRGDESRTYLERVVAADPTFGPAVFQLADIYQKQMEWAKAADVLKPVVDQDAANVDLQRQQAFFYLRAGQSDKARQLFADLLKVDPKDDRSRFFLAEALSDLDKHDEANSIFRKMLGEKPDDPELLVSYGLSQFEQRDYDGAVKTFRQLLTLPRLSPEVTTLARTELAAIQLKRGDFDAAAREASAIVVVDGKPNLQAAAVVLDAYKKQKKYTEAVTLLRSLSAQFPNEPTLGAREIEFLVRAGDRPAAAKIAETLSKAGKRSAMTAAEGYMQADAFDEAVRILEATQKASSEDTTVLFQLGSVYERAGRTADAEKVFLRILENDPDHAQTLNYLGYMWADKGVNLQRAEGLLQSAVRLQPRNPAFLDSLGWVYFQLGKFDEARKYLTDASQLMPHDATIRLHLGEALARLGDRGQALASLKAALTFEPEPKDEARIRSRISDLEKKR